MQKAAIVALAMATLMLSACDTECGTVRRTVANGTVIDASNVTLATATADLSDNVNPTYLRLSVAILGSPGSAGAPLKGHVTRARLVNDQNELIAEIPTSTASIFSDAVVVLNRDISSETEYSRTRDQLLTGRTKITLSTDIPGQENIETVLTDAHDTSGDVHSCHYSLS
jgi:hypothetical protein